MKILVCVKQVPDSAETLSINDAPPRIIYGDASVFRMNRYDEFALEEALLTRERFPDCTVDAVSVGPQRVRSTIRKALEMGADQGIHILVESGEYVSPLARASLIAEYARSRSYDLVLAGIMAEDDMEFQVGQVLAELMGLPCATSVMLQEMDRMRGTVYVEREIEGGDRECLTIALPAVLTIQSGMNTPRYPSLSNVLRARRQDLVTIDPPQRWPGRETQLITALSYPDAGSPGNFLEGSTVDKARGLIRILHEHSLL